MSNKWNMVLIAVFAVTLGAVGSAHAQGTTGSCATADPFTAFGGGTCVNGGWIPPGMTLPGAPTTPPRDPVPGGCVTPDPFAAFGGGTCVNGGWLAPGMTPPAAPTTPSPTPGGCATPDPFTAIGGGTCVNGGWLPPGIAPPSAPPAPPSPSPTTGGCVTPDPFTAIGGGTCVNGGWLPPGIPAPSDPSPATCAGSDPFANIPDLHGTCVNGGWIPTPGPATPVCGDAFTCNLGLYTLVAVNGQAVPLVVGQSGAFRQEWIGGSVTLCLDCTPGGGPQMLGLVAFRDYQNNLLQESGIQSSLSTVTSNGTSNGISSFTAVTTDGDSVQVTIDPVGQLMLNDSVGGVVMTFARTPRPSLPAFAGTYALTSVNGHALPATVANQFETSVFTSGVLSIGDQGVVSGSFAGQTQSGGLSLPLPPVQANLTAAGGSVYRLVEEPSITLTFGPNGTLTYSDPTAGLVLMYVVSR